jgi:hypothetical protein
VSLWALGCGEQFADPIGGPRVPIASGDPCAQWTSENECRADEEHACSVQPNPVGCRTSDPACAASTCTTGDPFVRRNGAVLTLHGEPYRFAGTNSWAVAHDPDGCRVVEIPDADAAAARTFDDMTELGARVLRVWAFQSFAGASGTDYQAFERLMVHARRSGVRMIFVLENHYDDCTNGARDDEWYRTEHMAPYDGYALSYVEYVERLVEHFKDEPAILAWELVHEARADDFAALNGFVQRMTAAIRVRDPNHLISPGVEEGSSAATNNEGASSNYRALHAHPTVDLVDVHDFGPVDEPLTENARRAFAIAGALGKPAFIGAIGVNLDDESASAFTLRANRVGAKLAAAYEHGFAGALVFDYYPDWTDPDYSFDLRAADPLSGPSGVVTRAAAQFRGDQR